MQLRQCPLLPFGCGSTIWQALAIGVSPVAAVNAVSCASSASEERLPGEEHLRHARACLCCRLGRTVPARHLRPNGMEPCAIGCFGVESDGHVVNHARCRQYLLQLVVGGLASRHEFPKGADCLSDGQEASPASGENVDFCDCFNRDCGKRVGHREFLPETLTNTIYGQHSAAFKTQFAAHLGHCGS